MTILDEIRADHARTQATLEALKTEMQGGFRQIDLRLATVEVKVAEVKADLMKWSFLFWCGAVASIAALAGAFR